MSDAVGFVGGAHKQSSEAHSTSSSTAATRGSLPSTRCSPAVVEDLKVFEYGVGQLDSGPPSSPVEQFDLHPCPERFDHGIIEAVPDRPHRWDEAGLTGSVGEGPRGDLGALVAVDQGSVGSPVVDGHAEC